MNTKKQKGFTIIELIVVIAIIAILAAIVLINVSGYINKGKDASVNETMHTLLTDAIANSANGTNYTGLCTATGTAAMAPTTTDWTAIGKLQTTAANMKCTASNESTPLGFCACVQSLANSSNYWCIDSTGASKSESSSCLALCGTSAASTVMVCP